MYTKPWLIPELVVFFMLELFTIQSVLSGLTLIPPRKSWRTVAQNHFKKLKIFFYGSKMEREVTQDY